MTKPLKRKLRRYSREWQAIYLEGCQDGATNAHQSAYSKGMKDGESDGYARGYAHGRNELMANSTVGNADWIGIIAGTV